MKYPGLCVFRSDVQSLFHDQSPADLRSEGLECLTVLLEGTVDVQMIRVHRRDGGDGGVELEERAVELVGLRDDCRGVAREKVRVVVLRDASQESRAAFSAFRQDVRHKSAGGCLSMRSGHGEACLPLGQFSKHA